MSPIPEAKTGAPNIQDAGKVWILNTNGTLVGGFSYPSVPNDSQFGYAAVDTGNNVLIGSPGNGRVYIMSYAEAFSGSSYSGFTGDRFGEAVAGLANGATVLVGAPQRSGGAVDVFVGAGCS